MDSNTVSVIDSSTNTMINTINVGRTPLDLEYNPSNENIYVANENSGDVSIIKSSSNTVVETIDVEMPVALEYNPSNNDIYVANLFRNTVSVITTTPSPPVPTTPTEAIEDLISDLENLEGLPEGAKTAIVALLERALVLLSDDNTRNDASACNILGTAFMNQVNANERQATLTKTKLMTLEHKLKILEIYWAARITIIVGGELASISLPR